MEGERAVFALRTLKSPLVREAASIFEIQVDVILAQFSNLAECLPSATPMKMNLSATDTFAGIVCGTPAERRTFLA